MITGPLARKQFLRREYMKKVFVLLLFSALIVPAFSVTGRSGALRPSGGIAGADPVLGSPRGNPEREAIMGYCTLADLEGAYGADRISNWSRLDPDTVDRVMRNAAAEIDGYLLSGGSGKSGRGEIQNTRLLHGRRSFKTAFRQRASFRFAPAGFAGVLNGRRWYSQSRIQRR